MRAVNLLPRDERRERREGARTPVLVLAGGLAAVTAVAVVLTLACFRGRERTARRARGDRVDDREPAEGVESA